MLTKVEISNFQSHRDTVLNFVPGTNVIIGNTDTGKSALFRAIAWVLTNRPLGDAYRSEWGGDTRVVLHTAEGNIVERARTATKNEYIINGKVLTAFGSEVPQEVEDILGMDFANIQTQMDPPFLLSSTPGEAARLLNKAASIDDIDRAMSGLQKSFSKIARGMKYDEEQLSDQVTQIKHYADIPQLEEEMQRAEKLEKSLGQKTATITALKRLSVRASMIEAQLEKTEHVPKLLQRLSSAESFYSSFRSRTAQYQKLAGLIEKITRLQRDLSSMGYVEQVAVELSAAEKRLSSWKEQRGELDELKLLVARGKKQSEALDKMQHEIDELEHEFHEQAPEYCPLCGNEWSRGD